MLGALSHCTVPLRYKRSTLFAGSHQISNRTWGFKHFRKNLFQGLYCQCISFIFTTPMIIPSKIPKLTQKDFFECLKSSFVLNFLNNSSSELSQLTHSAIKLHLKPSFILQIFSYQPVKFWPVWSTVPQCRHCYRYQLIKECV